MKGLRERKKSQMRASIVDTTIELVRERGYADTTVDAICERIEITTPTFYNYFKSKQDVLGQVYGRKTREWTEHISALPAGNNDSTDVLLNRHLAMAREEILQDAQLWRAIILYGDTNLVENTQQQEVEGEAFDAGTALFERGQSRGDVTREYPAELLQLVFSGALYATLYAWALGEVDDTELQETLEGIVAVCFDGMRHRSKGEQQ